MNENLENLKSLNIKENVIGNSLDPEEDKNKIFSQIITTNTNETKFYDELRTVIKTQENILTMTSMAKEKIKYANEISVDQLKNFKENSLKYGKYLKLINEELHMVGDLMKKIKKSCSCTN